MKGLKLFLIATLVLLTINPPAFSETVIINTKTHIYHKITAKHAKKCKKTCIRDSKQNAIWVYEARPCKICYKKRK